MNEWTTPPVPRGFWADSANRRRYADWLAAELGYTTPDAWYAARRKDFSEHFGAGLLRTHYGDSLNRFVMENYPDHPWRQWLFASVPNGFWDDPANRHAFMTYLGEKLGCDEPENWYHVTGRHFHAHGGGGLLVSKYNGSPQLAVVDHMPDYPWKPEEFAAGKKSQKALFRIVQTYFHFFKNEWNFKHKVMRFVKSDFPMELDVFVPHFNLAFEYQGEQHFHPIECWGGQAALDATRARDEEKRRMCKAFHITLIEVDYTWRGEKERIIEAIRQVLQDRAARRPEFRVVGSKKYKLLLPVRKPAPAPAAPPLPPPPV